MADQGKHDKTVDEKADMETTVNGALLKELFESIDVTIDKNNTSINDLKTITTAVALNTAKTGISTSQASAITANTAKTGITTAQASAITANSAKTGISTAQASQLTGLGKGQIPVGTGTLAIQFNAKTNALTFTYRQGKIIKSGSITLK
jgi:hypothetical protein